MKNIFVTFFFSIAIFIFNSNLIIASSGNKKLTKNYSNVSNKTGGWYLPSTGTIKVLLIFSQFPDDKYDTANSSWPKSGTPYNMNGWIDSVWSNHPTTGSLTDYFNVMSFDKLHFIGKAVSVVTPHSRSWYLKNNKKCYEIQKDVIQKVDSTLDFAQFDNWTFNRTYDHINKPDGIVDMVFIIWRNVANDFPKSPVDSVALIQKKLGIGRDASLDNATFRPVIPVDGGKREINPNTLGGGATLRDYFSANMFRFVIHEFGHYLEGANEMHVGFGFWGLLSAWGIKSFVVNSYEREKLDWSKPVLVYADSPNIIDAPLRDFITTGDAYKLVIDKKRNEYFYIENHENISYWEIHQVSGKVEKGIYVIRQDGPFGIQLHDIPADGRYDWTVDQKADNPWIKEKLPVFKQLSQDRQNGYHDLQFIPWNWKGQPQNPQPIHLMEDSVTGQPKIDVRFHGDGNDAFRIGYKIYFNPWSNPDNQKANRTTTNFGFKLDSVNSKGTYYLDIYTDMDEYKINHDAVLSAGKWNVNKDVTIEKGITFSISPGADIILDNNSKIIVNGTLIAVGDSTNKIIVERMNNENTGSNIIIDGKDASESKLENVILKNGVKIKETSGAKVFINHLKKFNNFKE